MTNDPLRIIDEFLAPEVTSDPAIRRNAVTALAVVGSESSLARLVAVALSDPDPGVRQQTEDEIVALPPELRATACSTAQTALDDPAKRRTTYALLGRLRCRGVAPPAVRPPLRQRLRAVATLFALHPEAQRRRFPWKSSLLAAGVALVSALLVAAFLRLSGDVVLGSENLVLLGLSPLICGLLALCISPLASPILLHLYRGLGSLFELLKVGLVAACFALPVLSILWILAAKQVPVAVWFGLVGAAAAVVFAVRLGSMLGSLSFAKPWTRALAGTASGATLGVIASTALGLWAHRDPTNDLQHLLYDRAWLVSIPAAIGLAWLLGRLDRRPLMDVPAASRGTRALTVAIVGTGAVALVMAGRPAPQGSSVLPFDPKKAAIDRVYKVDTVPFEVSFETYYPCQMKAEFSIDGAHEPAWDLTLYENPPSFSQVAYGGENDLIDRRISASTYLLRVADVNAKPPSEAPSDVFLFVASRLLHRHLLEAQGAPAPGGQPLNPPGRLTFTITSASDGGLSADNRVGPQPVLSPAGFLNLGDQVQVKMPRDHEEGPRWVPDMGALAATPMTVAAINQARSTFDALENHRHWYIPWVTLLRSKGKQWRSLPGALHTPLGEVSLGAAVHFKSPVFVAGDRQGSEMAALAGQPLVVQALFTDGTKNYVGVKGSAYPWPAELIVQIDAAKPGS